MRKKFIDEAANRKKSSCNIYVSVCQGWIRKLLKALLEIM